MLKTKFPDCLRNSRNLQLSNIYLKHLGYDDIPALLTIYELEKPAIRAYNEIKLIFTEVENDQISEYSIKGLFSLAIAHFETMLSDLMKVQLQFFPNKIGSYKVETEEGKKFTKEISVSKKMIVPGPILENIIDLEIQKISYKDIENLISAFRNIMSIKLEFSEVKLSHLIEIKETRNLLLHNNLYVNSFYLNKTTIIKRSTEFGKLIPLNRPYVIDSLKLILELVYQVISELRSTYGKYTLLKMLSDLWRYTFKNESIKLEDVTTINIEKDIFEGPFNFPGYLSSSEKMYMEFWHSQRTGKQINSLSMVNFGSGTKLSFLADVFGELRLTHW